MGVLAQSMRPIMVDDTFGECTGSTGEGAAAAALTGAPAAAVDGPAAGEGVKDVPVQASRQAMEAH